MQLLKCNGNLKNKNTQNMYLELNPFNTFLESKMVMIMRLSFTYCYDIFIANLK